jgi:hypothetical protein
MGSEDAADVDYVHGNSLFVWRAVIPCRPASRVAGPGSVSPAHGTQVGRFIACESATSKSPSILAH